MKEFTITENGVRRTYSESNGRFYEQDTNQFAKHNKVRISKQEFETAQRVYAELAQQGSKF